MQTPQVQPAPLWPWKRRSICVWVAQHGQGVRPYLVYYSTISRSCSGTDLLRRRSSVTAQLAGASTGGCAPGQAAFVRPRSANGHDRSFPSEVRFNSNKFTRREAHWQSLSGIAVSRPVNHDAASVRVLRIPT
jgi:hypothetical protein